MQLEFPVERLRSIQLGLTVVPLCLAPLFFGSVDQLSVVVWVTLLSAAMLCGAALPMNTAQRRVLLGFLVLCGAYAAVAVVQIMPGLAGGLEDPIWRRVSQLLPFSASPRISARAEIPAKAIGHFLLAVTSFTSGFFVGTSRRNSEVLTAAARHSILLYAAYGMFALALTPGMLLWSPKLAYHGSLTATFVNHNTAATLIGCGLILWFCLAFQTLQSLQFRSVRELILTSSNEHVAFKFILRSGAALTCMFALLLTGSRGGLICSILGLLVAIGLMVAGVFRARFWYALISAVAALAIVLVWLSHVGPIGSKGFFDDGRWLVYQYCVEIIRQRPLMGTGAGTFADIFPSLRGTEFNSWGVWDFAHSTILEIAVEMGILIASAIALSAVISLLILARAALKLGWKDRSRGSLAAIAGIATASYLHSIIDFSLQIPGYLIVFGCLLGCGLARSVAEQVPVRQARSRRFGSIGPDAEVAGLALETPPAASQGKIS
jgi:O-antigen ligase